MKAETAGEEKQSSVSLPRRHPCFLRLELWTVGIYPVQLLVTGNWKPFSVTENLWCRLHETLEDSCSTVILWLVWVKDNH